MTRRASTIDAVEAARDAGYPLSRWTFRPAARKLAQRLKHGRIRPSHFTWANLALCLAAAGMLWAQPTFGAAAAALVMGAWFCDRVDGCLARASGTASPAGAWLDGNIDELTDVALHAALASALATLTGNPGVWGLYVGFLAGKHLLMHGLYMTQREEAEEPAKAGFVEENGAKRILRTLYHLPANADVRVHLLAAALVLSAWKPWWAAAELLGLALYYNLRWAARYGWAGRRGTVGASARKVEGPTISRAA